MADASSSTDNSWESRIFGCKTAMQNPELDIAQALLRALADWPARWRLLQLNRHWAQLARAPPLWRLLCELLEESEAVYVPPVLVDSSWRAAFERFFPLRERWTFVPPTEDEIRAAKTCGTVSEWLKRSRTGEQDLELAHGPAPPAKRYDFSVSVVARLKPLAAAALDGASAARVVRLPLHQRLALIREQCQCDEREARLQLFGPQGDPFEGAFIPEEAEQAVEQILAARQAVAPSAAVSAAAEASEGLVSVGPRHLTMCAHGVGLREFVCFDRVFNEGGTQGLVYETAAREQVGQFINGLNATLMCYGQTGSGKTFTIAGPTAHSACSLALTGDSGIIPRACHEVMAAVVRRAALGIRSELQLSFMEVYGERVTDLLQKDEAVGAWQGTAARAALEGRCGVTVTSAEHLEGLLRAGEENKRRAATAMNERSSRAHSLLMLQLTQWPKGWSGTEGVTSQLCLCDLGGSEQLKKSQAEGERKCEAIQINLGLLALKECITALVEKREYVPYQNSKLTMLLSSALGGDCKTAIVVTASADPRHATETMQALRFGEKCATVQTSAVAADCGLKAVLAALDDEVRACEELIVNKERWELVEQPLAVDEFGDGGGMITKSVLCGAESERRRLEQLLQRRRELTGEAAPGAEPADGVGELRAEEPAAPEEPAECTLVVEPPSKPRIPARLRARLQGGNSTDENQRQARADKIAARQAQAEEKRRRQAEAKSAKARAAIEKMTRPLRRDGKEGEPARAVLHPTYENMDPDRPLPAPPAGFWEAKPEAPAEVVLDNKIRHG